MAVMTHWVVPHYVNAGERIEDNRKINAVGIALIAVAIANLVAAFIYEAWWMIVVVAGVLAIFATQWESGETD